MPKKPAKRSRPGFQTSIRLSDSEHAEFQNAAEAEGFSSIASWMTDLARNRAQLVNKAIASGEFITVRGRKIPLSDLPPGVTVGKSPKSPG